MAKRELVGLFNAIAGRDWAAAENTARALIDGEERAGHHLTASRLRTALALNGHAIPQPGPRHANGATTLHAPAHDALAPIAPAPGGLRSVSLRAATRRTLEELVDEWRQRDRLEAAGLAPRTKLLIHGPPGCGKSLTGRALAAELGIPAYVVRLDAVIGAYLGQTALRIRDLFRFAASTRCLLLLDEVDALGRARGAPHDVGELDRVVISLMQQLEHTHPEGMIIATSNVAGSLDTALLRRFDLTLQFPRPTASELRAFGKRRAAELHFAFDAALARRIAAAKSYAEAERLVIDAARRRLLSQQ